MLLLSCSFSRPRSSHGGYVSHSYPCFYHQMRSCLATYHGASLLSLFERDAVTALNDLEAPRHLLPFHVEAVFFTYVFVRKLSKLLRSRDTGSFVFSSKVSDHSRFLHSSPWRVLESSLRFSPRFLFPTPPLHPVFPCVFFPASRREKKVPNSSSLLLRPLFFHPFVVFPSVVGIRRLFCPRIFLSFFSGHFSTCDLQLLVS